MNNDLITQAVQRLRPGKCFSVNGETLDGFTWLDAPGDKPTNQAITDMVATIQAEQATPAYAAKKELERLDTWLPRVTEDLLSRTGAIPVEGSHCANIMARKRELRAIIRGSGDGASMEPRVIGEILNEMGENLDDVKNAMDALVDITVDSTGQLTAVAPADAKTNYGLVAAILGADANATNAKQNATATVVNEHRLVINSLLLQVHALQTAVSNLYQAWHAQQGD